MPEPGLIMSFIAIGYIVYLIEQMLNVPDEEEDDDIYFD